MYNITLLSSFHLEDGRCNPTELYRIIESIQPDVIFEELCSDTFDVAYSDGCIPNTIEAKTIKMYLQNHLINHFPVDTYEFSESDMFDKYTMITENSADYLELLSKLYFSAVHFGYSFLNSDECVEIIEKMHIVEDSVLSEINDAKISCQYRKWREINSKREDEMIRNIYNFSKQHQYNNAMFICGAEHRKPIMQKIQEIEKTSAIKLNWNFYNS